MAGYTGSLPADPRDLAKTYFRRPEVHRLLATLEGGPLSERAARHQLTGTPTSLADLERMRLITQREGKIGIGFAYFTASDMELIHRVATTYARSLVTAYRAKRGDFDTDFGRYPVSSVSRKRLAFVLLAGFSLNWDGLDLLREKGYRRPLLVKGPGWQYSFWAEEDTAGFSYKGYYWGSSSFPAGAANVTPPTDFTFSSFGDPYSDPRQNFPDLLALPPDQMSAPVRASAEALGFRDEKAFGTDFHNILGVSRTREIGDMLFAMRAGAKSANAICAVLTSESNRCAALLQLLVASGYIQKDEAGYRLLVPVLDEGDKELIHRTLEHSRDVMQHWLDRNFIAMRRALSGLTAVKAGVPYPALFSQIWHEVFGLTTRELAEDGMIEDANSSTSPWKGSVPAVWRMSVFMHVWE